MKKIITVLLATVLAVAAFSQQIGKVTRKTSSPIVTAEVKEKLPWQQDDVSNIIGAQKDTATINTPLITGKDLIDLDNLLQEKVTVKQYNELRGMLQYLYGVWEEKRKKYNEKKK